MIGIDDDVGLQLFLGDIINMNLAVLVLVSTIAFSLGLKAQLVLLQHDPFLFRLTFTDPIERPSFEILYNNVYSVPYKLLTEDQISSEYFIEAYPDGIKDQSNLQNYDLMFTNPLSIGGGQLQLGSYIVDASKVVTPVEFSTALGIFLLVCAYFLNFFTEIGKLAIQFIQFYILFMFKSQMVSTIYQPLYKGLLLIPPIEIVQQSNQDLTGFVILCLTLPVAMIGLMGVVGYLCKKFGPAQKDRSIMGNVIYQHLTFDLFVQSTRIFFFNLVFNSVQFLILLQSGAQVTQGIQKIGGVLVYFNLLSAVAIVYLKFYVLNPRLGQSEQSWKSYLQSEQFQDFRVFHSKSHLKPWYKRNYSFFNSLRMGLVVGCFYFGNLYQYFVLMIEFGHIYFNFTVRPFREQFYINMSVICRLLFLAEYIFIVLGNLYYSMGEITFNYYTVYSLVAARDYTFLAILLGFFVAVFFQIYFKCSNLSYKIRVVREDSLFPKIDFILKNRGDSEAKSKGNLAFSEKRSKSSSRPFDSMSDFSMLGSPLPKPPRRKSSNRKEQNEKRKRNTSNSKVQIQMSDLKQLKQVKQQQLTESGRLVSDKKRGKWKKQSLLQGMLQKPK